MKKTIRIVLPIVLAVAILLCTAWYLFIYDREFTRDVFLHTARYFESQGNPQLSAWCYDLAYQQSADNDAVAIELAQQHAAEGNFLQAEVTLTNAIANGATTELYVALCNVYLEQDKLMDAVKLLDAVCGDKSTADPAIQSQLRKMRPAAPTTDLEPGFYDPEQYTSVHITTTSGTLYLNPNGAYPTIGDALHTQLIGAIDYIGKHGKAPLSENGEYSQNVALSEGENVLYALAISKEGLVSPLSVYAYTLGAVKGGVVEEVAFVDSSMESAIRKALGVESGTVVMTDQIWDLTSFTVPAGISKTDDMRHLLGVEELTMDSAPVEALRHLSAYTNLKTLTVKNMSVQASDLAAIGNLPKLTRLTLSKCQLSALDGLENAQKLEALDLTGNTISSVAPLRELTGLKELTLRSNALSDVSAISGLTNLTSLDISSNQISSIAGIGNCGMLTELDISHNSVSSLSEVLKITGLLRLNFANNQVSTLPAWDKSCSLVTIDGSNNMITSLDPLSGLEQLNNVYMNHNANLQSVECLAKCPVLIQVNVSGTQVTNTKTLEDMSVIVNNDPE